MDQGYVVQLPEQPLLMAPFDIPKLRGASNNFLAFVRDRAAKNEDFLLGEL